MLKIQSNETTSKPDSNNAAENTSKEIQNKRKKHSPKGTKKTKNINSTEFKEKHSKKLKEKYTLNKSNSFSSLSELKTSKNAMNSNDKTKSLSTQKTGDVKKSKRNYTQRHKSLNLSLEKTHTPEQSTSKTNQSNENNTSKKNVFEFMMQSRHKSIGTNSPGKDKTENDDTEENPDKKKFLKKRKLFLEDWAEKRGGTKRKIEERQKEKYILKVLDKRAKRMKDMLNISSDSNSQNVDEDSNDSIVQDTKTKKPKIIVSDSENSSDFDIKINESLINKEKQNGVEDTSNSMSPQEIAKEKENPCTPNSKTNLYSYFEKTSKSMSFSTENDEDLIEKNLQLNNKTTFHNVLEQNENIIKVKFNFSPKSHKKKKKHKNTSSTSETTQNSNKNTTKNNLNDSLDDFEIFPNSHISDDKKKIKHKTSEEKSPNTPNIKKPQIKIRIFEKIEKNEEIDDDVLIIEDNQAEIIKPTKVNRKFNSSLKKDVKLAPLFVKNDPATKEARRKFLLSDIPDHMRKKIEKQTILEKIDLDLFPKISHIYQKTNSIFWNLPETNLKLQDQDTNVPNLTDKIKIGSFTSAESLLNLPTKSKQLHKPPMKISNIKQQIEEIKRDNPNHPVYKIFRILYEKNFKKPEENKENLVETKPVLTKRKRGRPKKVKPNNNPPDSKEDSHNFKTNTADLSIWTDKYKPQTSEEIFGNTVAVKQLKTWLDTWMEFSTNIRCSRSRKNSESSGDFCFDSESCDSDMLPQNMMLVLGPYGSGKTTAIYAICQELGINVLEINASSKRPGKRILLELQEATKSHRVKNESRSLNGFFKPTDSKSQEDKHRKLSLLLVEDIDIVFDDQDEGFINAVNTLITTSKRPIILTSADSNCIHIKKMVSQSKCVIFKRLLGKTLSVWLQILCLLEGLNVPKKLLSNLIDFYEGDMRKTLLQLQFWGQTGGDPLKITKTHPPISQLSIRMSRKASSDTEMKFDDESSNLTWFSAKEVINDEKNDKYIHKSCLWSFGTNVNEVQLAPNLTSIWWNLPSVLIHDYGVKNDEMNGSTSVLFTTQGTHDGNKKSRVHLVDLVEVYDSLANADVMLGKISCCGPTKNFWEREPVNSLSLVNDEALYDECDDISQEITQWCVSKSIEKYKKKSGIDGGSFNPAVPTIEEKRWIKKQHDSCDGLLSAIPIAYHTERRAICLDYFSALRTISRTEHDRSGSNSKRSNRFYHYLKGMGVDFTETMYDLVCNTLRTG